MTTARARRRVALSLAAAAAVALEGCGGDATPSGKVPTGGPPPAGFATEVLAAQNAVRADPGAYGGAPAPIPALAPLAWSADVAARAQAYADGCVYAHDANALRSLGYGENLAATAPPDAYAPTAVVGLWAAEAPHYHHDTNTCDAGQQCGHYTQLVWRSTAVAGCGVQTCTAASWPFQGGTPGPWQLWVCDYAPPGNFVGERPY